MGKPKTARTAKPHYAKSKPKAKPKSKTKSVAPKPTVEVLSDMDRQRLCLDHKRRIKPLIEAHKETASDLREAFELAKAEGVPKKMIEAALLSDTEEGQKKLRAQWQMLADVDRYTGKKIGTQLDFWDKASPKEAAFEQGRIAALNHEPGRTPTHLLNYEQSWLEGYNSGSAQVKTANTNALRGFTTLGDAASRATGAEAVDSLTDDEELEAA